MGGGGGPLLPRWTLPQLRAACVQLRVMTTTTTSGWRSEEDKRRVGLGNPATLSPTLGRETTLTRAPNSQRLAPNTNFKKETRTFVDPLTKQRKSCKLTITTTEIKKIVNGTTIVTPPLSSLRLFRRHFTLSPFLPSPPTDSKSPSITTTPQPRLPPDKEIMEQNRKRTARARISAILFDLDNTLIETRKADTITCQKIAELMTREMDVPAGPAKKITDTFLRRFRRCPENIRVPLDEWRCTLWSEALGDDYEELAEDIYPRWKKLRYRNLVLSEANANMLRQLHKEYQLAIVTNGPSNSQWEKIREMKLQQYFDVIVVSGDLKWEKPQPEIFLRACQMLGVEPFECLMIGDKLETDIAGGFQAQLGITVWVPNSDDEGRTAPLNPPPDFTIPDVSELVQILQGGKDKNKAGKNVRAKKTSTSSGATTSATPSTSEGLPNGTTTTSNSRVAPAVASTSAAAAASTASANKTSTAQADED